MLAKWKNALKVYFDRRMIVMLLLGFSSGFPTSIVGSSLTWWLKSLGIGEKKIGLFSLAKTPISFKWAWSPVVDRIRLPFLWKLGRRRSWAIFSQILLLISIFSMSQVDPVFSIGLMFGLAVLVVIASSTQDIALDAYRIEIFEEKEQAAGTATFVLGYRIGMIFSGAGALFLSSIYGWKIVYILLALSSIIGMVTILFIKESSKELNIVENSASNLEKIRIFFDETLKQPALDFMKRANWKLILLFVFLYKMSDAYIGPMAYAFYQDMGFSENEVAAVSKLYGVIATIFGGILGGLIVSRFGLMKSLFLGGFLQGISNLLFVVQAKSGHDISVLIFVIGVENIAGGVATAAFIAYLSTIAKSLYTATQYAILTSLVAVLVNIVSSTSGFLVSFVGWEWFFIISSFMALPAMIVLYFIYIFEKNQK